MKEKKRYFTVYEIILWASSLTLITLSAIIFKSVSPLSLIASLVGATSLIFYAKGNPLGPILMIVFSILYGIISLSFAYYGELLTYVGMSAPISLFTLIVWLRHPFQGKRSQVEVGKFARKDIIFLVISTIAVTTVFYFLLKWLNTPNLIVSTISVATSFVAAYLQMKRVPAFAIAYALNDIVLIILWVLASVKDITYIPVVVCFSVFLFNDMYGFINWLRMRRVQKEISGPNKT